jgi:regulator of protease activity HflC (stomatin/prohibitin superfamily)
MLARTAGALSRLNQGQAAALAGCCGLLLVIGAFAVLSAFKAVAPSDVCVVQEGGPLDGRGIAQVRQPSGGVSFVGLFNSQRCFPATQRNYVISPEPAHREHGDTLSFFETPTSDAIQVRIEGQALFRFNTDPAAVRSFYTKYGVRTFDGSHPYEGSDGWRKFLSVQFRPVLHNALREAVGKYRCVELNNTCAYVQDSAAAVTGKVDVDVDNAQNLSKVQEEIGRTLEADLESTLGGRYFEDVQFRLVQVKFDGEVQKSITAATAARADVATKRLEAQQRVETAIGDRRAAQEKARAIRSTRRAYRENPSQARIDAIRALPSGLQALGGNLSTIVGDAAR